MCFEFTCPSRENEVVNYNFIKNLLSIVDFSKNLRDEAATGMNENDNTSSHLNSFRWKFSLKFSLRSVKIQNREEDRKFEPGVIFLAYMKYPGWGKTYHSLNITNNVCGVLQLWEFFFLYFHDPTNPDFLIFPNDTLYNVFKKYSRCCKMIRKRK